MARPLPAALRQLLAQQQIEPDRAEPLPAAAGWRITGQRWVAVVVPGRALPLHVALPVQGEARRGADGPWQLRITPPSAGAIAEATAFARSLASHGQIGMRGAASHEIVVDGQGREKLVRRGFSAR